MAVTGVKSCCFMCGCPEADGIRILGQIMCVDCEQFLVHLAVDDPRYDLAVACLRRRLIQRLRLAESEVFEFQS